MESDLQFEGGTEVVPESGQNVSIQSEIGHKFADAGLVSKEQLSEALSILSNRGGKVYSLLIGMGYLESSALHGFLSRQGGVAGIDLAHYEVDGDSLQILDEDFCRSQCVLPIDKLGSLLTIAMVCPLDTAAIEAVKDRTNLKVKPLLCGYDAFQQAIDQVYRKPETLDVAALYGHLGDTASSSEAEAIRRQLTSISTLPAFSDTARRLQEISGDPNGTVRDVAFAARKDPHAAMQLLRVANTTPYGVPGEVSDITLAAVMLGKTGACDVVLGGPVAKDADEDAPFDFKRYRNRAIFCADAAQAFAEASRKASPQEAYTSGLLHQVGRLALATLDPEEYGDTAKNLAGEALLEAEQKQFQITHPDAGYMLAQGWGLPIALQDCIKNHNPSEAATPLEAAAALAAAVCDRIEQNQGKEIPDGLDALLDALGITKQTAQKALEAASMASASTVR